MRALVWVVFAVGCVQSSSIDCSDGLVCPDGTRCAPVPSHSLEVCAQEPDLTACTGMADGTACETSGSCVDGVCLHHCGDGVRTGAEECDGADLGSNANCTDLGYYDSAPLVCSPACTYDVVGDYSTGCTGKCGDGMVNGPEACEDSLGWQDVRTCYDFGFDYGHVECAQCGPSFTGCKEIEFVPKLFESGPMHGTGDNNIWFLWGASAYHFDGTDWKLTSLPNAGFYAIWVDSPTDVWAAGQGGTPIMGLYGQIAHWDGTSWTNVQVSSVDFVTGIWSAGNGDAWAVGYTGTNGSIVHFVGGTADTISVPVMPPLRAIWGSGASDVWAVGDSGTIVHYDGNSWQQVSSPTNASLYGIYGSSATDVWAVGGAEIIHKTAAWVSVPAPAGAASGLGVVWTDGSHVWVGGYQCLFEYDGAMWRSFPGTYDVRKQGIWGTSDTDVWIGIEDVSGVFTLGHYGGAAWAQAHVQDSSSISSVWFDGTHPWAAVMSSANVASIYDYDGANWSLMSAVSGTQAQATFAGTSSGDVWVLRDFSQAINPGDPWAQIDHFDGGSWSTKLSITGTGPRPNAIWAFSPTDAIAIGDGVWHWDGGSWTQTSTTPGAHHMWASSPTDIWAGADDGTIAHYDGVSWTTSLPGQNQIISMWGSGPNDVWAIGVVSIFHYDGTSWTTVHLPSSSYSRVTGSGPNDVFIVANGGPIYHWDGVAWARVRTTFSQPASAWASGNRLWFGLSSTGDVVDLLREPGW